MSEKAPEFVDELSLGATRPAMFFGVSAGVAILSMAANLMAFIVIESWFFMISLFICHGIFAYICREDPHYVTVLWRSWRLTRWHLKFGQSPRLNHYAP